MTLAALGIDIKSAAAVAAARDLDQLTAAAGRTKREVTEAANAATTSIARLGASARTVQQQIDATFGIGASSMRNRAADVAAYGAELDALRAKFNPLFAASKQYEAQLEEISKAERLGAISANEAAEARQRAAASMAPLTGQVRVLGETSHVATGHVGNLTAQLNDIFMMVQAGQAPMQLAIQQGSQITQAFQSMGGGALTAVKSIGAAFVAMLSPLNLATYAIIAFGATGVQALMSLRGESKDLEDMQDDLAEAIASVESAVQMQRSSVEDLIDTYGEAGARVTSLVDAMAQIARDDAAKRVNDLLQGTLSQYADMTAVAVPDVGAGGELADQIAKQFEGATVGLDRLVADLKLAAPVARDLQAAMVEVSEAESFDDQAKALGRLSKLLKDQEDQFGRLPEPIAEIYKQVVSVEDQVSRLAGLTGGVTEGFDRSARAASALADRVAEMSAAARDASTNAAINLEFVGNPIGAAEAKAAADFDRVLSDAGVTVGKIKDDFSLARDEIIRTAGETARTADEADAARAAAEALASALDGAGSGAAFIADELGRAVSNALSAASAMRQAASDAQLQVKYFNDPVGLAGARFDATAGAAGAADPTIANVLHQKRMEVVADAEANARAEAQLDALREQAREAARSGRRSGGGGGRGGANEEENRLKREKEARDRVIEGLKYEIEMVGKSELAREQAASARRAYVSLSSEEGQAIAELVRQNYELNDAWDKQAEAAQFAADSVSDIFSAAIGGAEDAKEAVGDLIGRLADLAIDSAFQALFMPGGNAGGGLLGALGGFFGLAGAATAPLAGTNLLAGSYAGGGYTGNGPRSGGLDGQGGFLAMMHPQESVIDHAAGQGAGGSTIVVNHAPVINAQNADPSVVPQIKALLEAQRADIEQSIPLRIRRAMADPRYLGR